MAQMLTVALPKGRLGDKVYNLLESVGYDCSEIREDGASWSLKTRPRGCGICWSSPAM